jgi:hypothetical protein
MENSTAKKEPVWVDVTSWAARQTSGGRPAAWRLKTGAIHITVKLVQTGPAKNDGYFTCYCPEAGIYQEALRGSYTPEHAQASAVIMVKQKLQKMLSALDDFAMKGGEGDE